VPVKRKSVAAPETGLQRAARIETEDMLGRGIAGQLSVAEQRARTVELIELDRQLTPDERHEWKRLARGYRKRRRESAAFAARSARARAKWAKRVGTPWAAAWEARAADEGARRGVPSIGGAELYHLHVVTETAKRERQAAKDAARALARETAQREAQAAALAESAREAASAPARPRPAAPLAEVEPDEEAPRRRRVRYGVVAQWDMHGDRIL